MQSTDLFSEDERSFPLNEPLQANHHELVQAEPDHQIGQLQPQPMIQIKYYQEFKKIFYTSYKLCKEIRKQTDIKNQLRDKIIHIETQLTNLHKTRRHEQVQQPQDEGEISSKRRTVKRARRTTQEIQRKYYCFAKFCDRSYGSQGSLQQHLKLKHPELSKRVGTTQEYC